jgi:hypothetical protein
MLTSRINFEQPDSQVFLITLSLTTKRQEEQGNSNFHIQHFQVLTIKLESVKLQRISNGRRRWKRRVPRVS